MNDENTAFVDGHSEPFVDFDFDSLDRGNPLVAELTEAANPNKQYREASKFFLEELSRIISFVAAYEHPRFAVYVIADAMGMVQITGNRTMDEIGAALGVTKAAVSKCVKQVQRRFGKTIEGIRPKIGQKSEQACRTYSENRKRKLNGHSRTTGIARNGDK
jgi:hypothetical protein